MTRPLSLAIQDGLILLSHYIIQNQTYQRTSAEPAKCFQRRQVKTGSFLMSLLRKSWVRLWKREYCFGKKKYWKIFQISLTSNMQYYEVYLADADWKSCVWNSSAFPHIGKVDAALLSKSCWALPSHTGRGGGCCYPWVWKHTCD